MTMGGSLHLLHLPLPVQRLMPFSRRHGVAGSDTGYQVHAALAAVFGEHAPKPFVVEDKGGEQLDVLAYADRSLDDLRAGRDPLAPPDIDALVDWALAGGKAMPALPAGRRLHFAVHVCPTVRLGRRPAGGKASGAELDAFLAALDRWETEGDTAPKPEREQIYTGWLRTALEHNDGAKVETIRLAGFRLERSLRKASTGNGKRKPMEIVHPTADLEGTLTVTEADIFRDLLARGIGRHRAFGFGMIRLRRTA